MTLTMDSCITRSERVVSREIEGEVILIPLVSGIADLETDIITFNAAGRAIWDRLDGRRLLRDVVDDLVRTFDADPGEIEADVLGFTSELVRRGILVSES